MVSFDVASRRIYFCGYVTPKAAAAVQVAIDEMVLDGDGPIQITIASKGGSVLGGDQMYDAIRTAPVKVVGRVFGPCWSAAVMPFLACDVREVGRYASVMIHDGTVDMPTLGVREAENDIKFWNQARRNYYTRIAERTGLPLAAVEKASRFATYYSAEEAVKNGFASTIVREKSPPRQSRRRG